MRRRDFVGKLGSTLGCATMMAMTCEATTPSSDSWLDCNVTLGLWPFRRSQLQSPAELSKKLSGHGVTEAWAGSFEAMFQDDIQSTNLRLVQDCRMTTNLLPVATINPALPDWRADLIHAHEKLSLSIVRLYPNYHGYKLDDPCFADFLRLATERQISLQLVVQIEDERTQSPLMQVPPVDLKPLAKQLQDHPAARVMILNASRTQLDLILPIGGVLFDIAKIEGASALEQLLETVSHERIVFGSHAPFFYWEAAQLKLKESELLDRQFAAIVHSNAKRWSNA